MGVDLQEIQLQEKARNITQLGSGVGDTTLIRSLSVVDSGYHADKYNTKTTCFRNIYVRP